MKAAPFKYVKAISVDHALGVIADDAADVKILAGGQSLVPMMNFRLARPSVVVDINKLSELRHVAQSDGSLVIGATTRHIDLQNRGGLDPLSFLLRRAASHIGHLPIRTRGTFGGSLAHSDATSEWCLVARLLDAEFSLVSQHREPRVVSAGDFFQSLFVTSMLPDELLTEVRLPVLDHKHHTGFVEFARRAGDFAIVSVGVDIEVEGGAVVDARVCIGGVAERPFRASTAEKALVGVDWEQLGSPAAEALKEAAELASQEISPRSDTHGSAEYRRDLVRALLPRAIQQAHETRRTS